MKWEQRKGARLGLTYVSEEGGFMVSPVQGRGYGNRRVKKVVYRLTERGHAIGKTFESAMLARAFAEALHEIGRDTPEQRRARAEFIRNGGEWCWQWVHARRRKRNEAWFARHRET